MHMRVYGIRTYHFLLQVLGYLIEAQRRLTNLLAAPVAIGRWAAYQRYMSVNHYAVTRILCMYSTICLSIYLSIFGLAADRLDCP